MSIPGFDAALPILTKVSFNPDEISLSSAEATTYGLLANIPADGGVTRFLVPWGDVTYMRQEIGDNPGTPLYIPGFLDGPQVNVSVLFNPDVETPLWDAGALPYGLFAVVPTDTGSVRWLVPWQQVTYLNQFIPDEPPGEEPHPL